VVEWAQASKIRNQAPAMDAPAGEGRVTSTVTSVTLSSSPPGLLHVYQLSVGAGRVALDNRLPATCKPKQGCKVLHNMCGWQCLPVNAVLLHVSLSPTVTRAQAAPWPAAAQTAAAHSVLASACCTRLCMHKQPAWSATVTVPARRCLNRMRSARCLHI
jgi:hypothetical protein